MNTKRTIKFYLLRLFRIKSKTKHIAMGFSLGFIPNLFPTFGLGPVISVAIAKLFKTNLISAFIGGISGTFIWPFLFYLNYAVGRAVLSVGNRIPHIGEHHIKSIHLFYYKTMHIGIDFFIGAIINTIVFTPLMYLVIYIIFTNYRTHYLKKIKTW